MLSRWLTINDQDKFSSRIFYTVREMFTVNYELVCSNILFMLQKADTDNHFTRSLTHRIDLITSKKQQIDIFLLASR